MMLAGIRVIESEHAVQCERVRRYPKRKGKSAAHWARMDKKWRKRYGYRYEPAFYIMDTSYVTLGGAGGKVLLAHPMIVAKLREASRAQP